MAKKHVQDQTFSFFPVTFPNKYTLPSLRWSASSQLFRFQWKGTSLAGRLAQPLTIVHNARWQTRLHPLWTGQYDQDASSEHNCGVSQVQNLQTKLAAFRSGGVEKLKIELSKSSGSKAYISPSPAIFPPCPDSSLWWIFYRVVVIRPMVIKRHITARGTMVRSMTYRAPVGANNVFNEMIADQFFLQSIPIRPAFLILSRIQDPGSRILGKSPW